MNRRFFLKLFPVATAAVAAPTVSALADKMPTVETLYISKWDGDGYYEVRDGLQNRVMLGERWTAFDTPHDGPCYRFSPTDTEVKQGKIYSYECALDCFIIRKLGGVGI